MSRSRIALIASARFAIREPFAGGLEAHTWALAKGLRRRGHEVTVFAGAGCDPELSEHHAYLQLLLELADRGRADFDVVHNNCLHYLPSRWPGRYPFR